LKATASKSFDFAKLIVETALKMCYPKQFFGEVCRDGKKVRFHDH
jgi:hypothetical protein